MGRADSGPVHHHCRLSNDAAGGGTLKFRFMHYDVALGRHCSRSGLPLGRPKLGETSPTCIWTGSTAFPFSVVSLINWVAGGSFSTLFLVFLLTFGTAPTGTLAGLMTQCSETTSCLCMSVGSFAAAICNAGDLELGTAVPPAHSCGPRLMQ